MSFRLQSTTVALTALLVQVARGAGAESLPSLAEPSLSPDRSEIVFVSGGDIWTVPAKGGEAHLLVSHPATESRPLFSPDGKKLAFTSTRTGNGDIYILTLATGQLKRMTYGDAPEGIDNWSHDGQWIYFSSSANDLGRNNDIFRVSVEGGTPLAVSREAYYNEFRAAPSPDGSKIAFVAKGSMSSSQWWRHGHSHIDESEIWVKPVAEAGRYTRIVREDAKQGWPMWAANGQSIFYTSDRSGSENIYRQALDEKAAPKQLTTFRDGRLLWPAISYDSREIVFERNFSVWKLETDSGRVAQVPITLRGAPATPEVTHRQFAEFSSMALSPDGKKIALLAHGEVFAGSATEPGEAQRLTTTPAPERGIRWSPDSNRVLYISNRNRHDQIFEYDLAKSAERQLTNTSEDDSGAEYSPDGKMVAFVREERELHTLNLETSKDQCVATGTLQLPAIAWSPDSKFIAFTQEGAKSFRNVHVVGSDGANAQPVSFLANGQTASGIAWSPDGKYLLFDTAQRSEPSQMARVDLVPHLPAYREDQFRELFRTQQSPDQTPATQPGVPPSKPSEVPLSAEKPVALSPLGAKASTKPVPVKIVFEGIRQRLTFVPLGFDCGKPVVSPDGKTLIFLAQTGNQQNIYLYSLDELSTTPRSVHQLTSTATPKSDIQFTADSKQVFYLDAGHVTSMSVEAHTPKPLAAIASLDIDFDLEKTVTFDEGWSILNKRFFDPEFNHQDWSALHDHYAPYIAGAHTPDEMRRIMNLMIGDLNASHSGIGPAPATPRPSSPQSPFSPMPTPVGHLGLRFEREPYEAGRGLVIREVIPLSPVSLEGTVKPGEQLVAVDHEEIGPHTNIDSLLQNKVDHRVVLQIAGANGGARRDVVVRPVSLATEEGLHYRAWVEANRAYVERVSGGKLGYVHIADMSSQSLTQLYIDLDVQNQTKQGVVIDIRSNYGGFVNAYAIDVFTRKNYLLMTRRGSETAPARPALGQRALGLPTILVTDQNSLSDAEDFTEGYRELKLGKVVGEPTAGWIIYTSNRPLIDGSMIRVPGIRIQTGDGQPMEMHPRPVDILIERLPGEADSGHDTQLDRAIQELVTQLGRTSG